MSTMTDKEKLISILENQDPQAINHDWNKEEYKIEKDQEGSVIVSFNEVGFVFDAITEQFKGSFNWKW